MLRRHARLIPLALAGALLSCSGAEKSAQETSLAAEIVRAREALKPLPPEGVRLSSEYSTLVVRDRDDMRILYFVRDSGDLAVQTRLQVDRPWRMLSQYTSTMFASYLFQEQPSEVLLVGLGGGAMLQFLQHHEPQLQIDAIDIDPVVVQVAADYFGTRPDERTRIEVADAFDYLRSGDKRWDVIYMDTFLKPSAETDSTGNPLRLRTLEFLEDIQQRLRPGGVVVFNLNLHPELQQDLAILEEAFEQTYVFQPRATGNFVVVCTLDPQRVSERSLRQRGEAIDQRLGADHSIAGLVRWLLP